MGKSQEDFYNENINLVGIDDIRAATELMLFLEDSNVGDAIQKVLTNLPHLKKCDSIDVIESECLLNCIKEQGDIDLELLLMQPII